MKKNLLDLNLQLFAEEEEVGAEEQTTAESDEEITGETPEESEEETEESTTEEESEEQDFKNETNATFANMRRKAEADAKAKYDSEIARLCKGYVHPITKQPITSLDEYKDAIYQQDRLSAEEKLRESGVDAETIDTLISNNPVIMQAQAVIEQSKQAEAERQLQADFEAIKAMDSSIKTMNDIPNMEIITNLIATNNMNLVDAYKIANFDSLMQNAKSGAKQGAINQMKGKAHMSGVDSLTTENGELEIPQAELNSYREAFPDKSDAELKKLYNKTIKKLGK